MHNIRYRHIYICFHFHLCSPMVVRSMWEKHIEKFKMMHRRMLHTRLIQYIYMDRVHSFYLISFSSKHLTLIIRLVISFCSNAYNIFFDWLLYSFHNLFFFFSLSLCYFSFNRHNLKFFFFIFFSKLINNQVIIIIVESGWYIMRKMVMNFIYSF